MKLIFVLLGLLVVVQSAPSPPPLLREGRIFSANSVSGDAFSLAKGSNIKIAQDGKSKGQIFDAASQTGNAGSAAVDSKVAILSTGDNDDNPTPAPAQPGSPNGGSQQGGKKIQKRAFSATSGSNGNSAVLISSSTINNIAVKENGETELNSNQLLAHCGFVKNENSENSAIPSTGVLEAGSGEKGHSTVALQDDKHSVISESKCRNGKKE